MIGTLKKMEQEYNKLQKQNLEELMRLTLINILNAKGIIYTYYKQQERKGNNNGRQSNIQINRV